MTMTTKWKGDENFALIQKYYSGIATICEDHTTQKTNEKHDSVILNCIEIFFLNENTAVHHTIDSIALRSTHIAEIDG